ncbi:MAG TPA: hypothetical protein VHQ43_01120 [Solirubrobacterales bacterium]|nr:hypothetical protein [Solirubrobacterales bacterium]
MRRTTLLRRRAGLAIAIAIAAGLAAGAIAYWSGNGSGTATTVLTDAQALSFEPGAPTAQLYPGNDASVVIVATNPNAFFVHIGSLSLDTDDGEPFAVDAPHASCDISVLSFVSQDNGGAGWNVPPRAGATDGTLAIDMASAMTMSTAAASACQGATFTVHLEVGP